MPYGTVNADVITTSTAGGVLGAGNASIMKNRIINGAMVIDQRNAGASVTPIDGQYTLDRWVSWLSQASKFTIQQNAGSVTPPVGFINYLGVTSSSAYTVGSSEFFGFAQYIEGLNIADLGWGTANAKTVTLSFWVRSSLTGTFGGAINNGSYNRSYPFTYTISSANTWTQISITIAGDTSGTWLTNNNSGIRIVFGLGMGSSVSGTAGTWASASYYSATGATSVVGTNGATFYITGVQLEVGSSATGYEYRQYGTELNLCLRYALMLKNGTTSIPRFGLGSTVNSTTVQMVIQHPVPFRAAATLTTTGTASDYEVYSVAVTACSVAPTMGDSSIFNSRLNFVTASGLTGGQIAQCAGANANSFLLFSAEL
jgi:hypothetical protein